jgi:hypothetical protein
VIGCDSMCCSSRSIGGTRVCPHSRQHCLVIFVCNFGLSVIRQCVYKGIAAAVACVHIIANVSLNA